MTAFTRRRFLRTGSIAAAATILPSSFAQAKSRSTIAALVSGEHAAGLRALAEAALGAATMAGATYSDVNFRSTVRERVTNVVQANPYTPSFDLRVGLGVRALVNGYWGFVGLDGIATVDAAAQLGRDAAVQAKTAARGKPRMVELAATPVVTGTWVMPVEIDPFTVSYEEKYDFLAAVNDSILRLGLDLLCVADLGFLREEHTFASSEGSFVTQTTYVTQAGWGVNVPEDWMTEKRGGRAANFLTFAGAGWEYHRTAPIRERAVQLIEDALRSRRAKPVDVGRYDIVFDAQAVAGLLDLSVGTATELDRAMGYEANGVGTTYLNDPLTMLGAFKVGSPLLTVTANRSMPGGAATVKWDDEGVAPQETTLVKDGILTDYQTTREAASWLEPYYQRTSRPVRSNGCGCGLGAVPFKQRNPNFVMQPGAENITVDDLIKDTKRGLAVLGGSTATDFQVLNGYGTGSLVYEITDGKLGNPIAGAQILYRAPEFWHNLQAIGGTNSAAPFGFERWRDDPENRTVHTVSAVPAKVTGVAVSDAMGRS